MISVVVPAFNEQAYISRCLVALEKQDYHGDFEIIVVDSRCSDDTVKIAQKHGVRVVKQEIGGVAPACQCGFMAAKGDVIASTDADTVVPEDWLSRIGRLFAQNPDAVAVAGHFHLLDGPLPVRFWLKISLFFMPFITRFVPKLWNFSGTSFAVKADVFRRVGGFDTKLVFGEDVELCQRLRKVGKIVFDAGLLVGTSGRSFYGDRFGFKNLFRYLGISLLRKRITR